MIPESTIQKIKDAAHIDEVVGDYVNLKRTGKNYKGLCPFHDEKTPSFSVDPGGNFFYCFGCHKGGDAVTFIMEHEGVNYPEALKILAGKYNIEVEERELSDEEKASQRKEDSLFIINEFAEDFYQKQLFGTDLGKSVGLSYFRDRGFRTPTLQKFGIGFAPSTGTALGDALKKKGYELEYARDLGLVNATGKDFFRDRVIFPIHQLSGKVCAFAGRTLQKGKKIPKYINSPESEIYEKRKLLYGLYQSRSAIRKEEQCILVEGYTDVMSLHQAGIENVVATSGTALSSEQAKLIRRFADEVVVLYDGDAAGIAAATRGLRILLTENLRVKVAMLPEGYDPDGYVQQKGKSSMLAFLEDEKKDFVIYQLEEIKREGASDPLKRAKGIKVLMETLSYVEDSLVRDSYLQHCSLELNVDESLLVSELNNFLQKRSVDLQRKRQREERQRSSVADMKGQRIPEPQQKQADVLDDVRERDVARVLIQHAEKPMGVDEESEDEEEEYSVGEYVLSEIEAAEYSFEHPVYAKVVDYYYSKIVEKEEVNIRDLVHHQEKDVQQFSIRCITEPYTYSENWEKKLEAPLRTQKMPEENHELDAIQAVNHLKQKILEQRMKKIQELLVQAMKDDQPESVEKYNEIHKKLVQTRKELHTYTRRVVL